MFFKKKSITFTLWKDSKSSNNHRTVMIKMKKNHSNILFWTSLVCSCPWGCKESDTTERLNWLNILFLLFSHSVVPNSLETPMDYSLPGSSVHGILQARTLECVAIPFSRGSSQPRDWTCVSSTASRFFTVWATREALHCWFTSPPSIWTNNLSGSLMK